MNKGLIAIPLIALFFLGGNKKSTSSTKKQTEEEKKEEQGDEGDPAGPNGCKPGLVVKDGICTKESSEDDEDKKGTVSKSSLTIGKDCKWFKFGDGTGESWWKNKGDKVAKQWIKSGETDLLTIAYSMLKGTGSICFKSFPIRTEFDNWYDYEMAKFSWINKNREMWKLLYWLRNKIDLVNFNGLETVSGEIKNNKLAITFPKGFNANNFWETIKATSLALLQKEAKNPGSVLGMYNDDMYRVSNVTTYILGMVLPNIPFETILTFYKKGMLDNELYDIIFDHINEYDGESIDLDFEP